MAEVHAADTTAQRKGQLERENKRLKTELARARSLFDFRGAAVQDLRVSLPGSYVGYLSWCARTHNKTLEDYLVDFLKESVLSEIDVMQQEDFAGFFGATLQRDYVEKGPSAGRFSKIEER